MAHSAEVEMLDIDMPPPGVERARAIPRAEWENRKQDITQIYYREKKPMAELVRAMERKGFKASEQQYFRMLRTWGIHKNNKRHELPSAQAQRRRAITSGSQTVRTNRPGAMVSLVPRSGEPSGSSVHNPNSTENTIGSSSYGMPNESSYALFTSGPAQGAPRQSTEYDPLFDPFLITHEMASLGTGFFDDNYQNDATDNFFNLVANPVDGTINNTNSGRMTRANSISGPPKSNGVIEKGGIQPIHRAVQAGSSNVVQFLLEADSNCAHLSDRHGNTPVWRASQEEHTRIVRQLITRYKVDVNVPNVYSKRTPLHQAAQSGHTEIARMLLDSQAKPDPQDKNGITPLWIAAQAGSAQIVSMLVDHPGVDINATSTDDCRTPLHQAAQGGFSEIVRVLVGKGAQIDSKDTNGISPLWSAAQHGSEELVKMLLDKGASPETMSTNGQNLRALHQAAQYGHTLVCKLLLASGANFDSLEATMCSPLFFAAQNGHLEIVKILLEKGANPENAWEGKDGRGRRCIHQASQNGHLEIVKALLAHSAHADPETDLTDGSSDYDSDDPAWELSEGFAIYDSSKGDSREKKKKVAEDSSKKHDNKPDERPPSPLSLAAQKGHYDVVELLITHGADVNSASHITNLRPIHRAVRYGDAKLTKLLINHGADVDCREQDGWPPLMLAAQAGHFNIIDELIQAGANVNAESDSGATALWIASQNGHTAAVQRLLDADARSFAVKSSGRYPIHQATQNAHFEVVKLLAEEDPSSLFIKDANGSTLMSLAAGGRETIRVDIMKYLRSMNVPIVDED